MLRLFPATATVMDFPLMILAGMLRWNLGDRFLDSGLNDFLSESH